MHLSPLLGFCRQHAVSVSSEGNKEESSRDPSSGGHQGYGVELESAEIKTLERETETEAYLRSLQSLETNVINMY